MSAVEPPTDGLPFRSARQSLTFGGAAPRLRSGPRAAVQAWEELRERLDEASQRPRRLQLDRAAALRKSRHSPAELCAR